MLWAGAMAVPVTAADTDEIKDMICQYDWDCGQALRVAHCESTMNPRAYNAGNRGLFQINEIHRAKVGGDLDSLYDPEVNIRTAYTIWSAQGWGPWACRP